MSRYDNMGFTQAEKDNLESEFSVEIDILDYTPRFRPVCPDDVWTLEHVAGVEEADDGVDAYDRWFRFTDDGRRAFRKKIAHLFWECRRDNREIRAKQEVSL